MNINHNKKYMNIKILLYVNYYEEPKKADYQHPIIALADGLNHLNIPYDSNINYYKLKDGSFLFKQKQNLNHNDYDLIFTTYSNGIIEGNKPYPYKSSLLPREVILNKNRKYKLVMLDHSDGFMKYISNSRYFDYYFITNYHKDIIKTIGKNIYPLVFNSTNRIIKATENENKFSDREITLLYSHRCKHANRSYMLDNIYINFNITYFNDNFDVPNNNDEYYLDWAQSGRRHNPQLYETYKKTKVLDCTGGQIIQHKLFGNILSQIDSFRLWEGFFSGCCVLTINLDKFGIKFPVQPINMVHYIGITLDKNIDNKIIKDIFNGTIDIEKIANNGKAWAIENYSPQSLVKHILNITT